jgi:tRNA threonylcarbamoyladenosine biosynthesis protein TsaB
LLVLAIDTTTRVGGFALARDGQILASRTLESDKGLAAALFGEIEALLAEAGVTLAEVDAFAALAGPGSFTGIRVGLAAVKALGEATGKPVLAVSNLEALAFAGEGSVRAVALPARGGDVFGAIFDSELRPLIPERQEPAETFEARAREAGARAVPTAGPLAEAAAKLVARRLPEAAAPPEAADANYVERPAVEK